MSCVPIPGGGAICGERSGLACRRILPCPTEHRRRRMVAVYGGPYYSDAVTCLGCGDSWSGGERGERPFARGWRDRAIATATQRWGTAVSPGRYAAEIRRRLDEEMKAA